MQICFHRRAEFASVACAGLLCVLGAPAGLAVADADTATTTAWISNANTNSGRQIILHFQDAPLESVLEYFAEAAGYKVSLEARAAGKVNVISDQPVTVVQALDLLNAVLKRNNLAAIRDGTNLTVINRDEAKVRGVPVRMGSDAARIPRNDEIVTQIMPLRFVPAADALKTLTPMLGSTVTATANESANLLVITDTQAHIHRLAEILAAMEADAAGFTVLKVFHLQNADPQEMADLLTQLFGSSSQSSESQSPFQMPSPFPGAGGPPFGPGGPGNEGNPANSNSGNSGDRLRKATQVVAVADARTTSVVVSASQGTIAQIQSVVTQLDSSAARKKRVAVYRIENGSPQHVAQVLQALFSKNASTGGSSAQNSSSQSDVLESRANQLGQQALSAAQSSSSGSSGGPGGQGGGGGGGMPQ